LQGGKIVLVVFTLNTLEYLHKGGRIGKVASLLGSILNIKPVVQVKKALENTFQIKVTFFTQVGAVIGVHTGPGTVGAAVLFDY